MTVTIGKTSTVDFSCIQVSTCCVCNPENSAHAIRSVQLHVKGQVENAETETEVRKRKYENGSTEVRRKTAYWCLVHKCAL